MAVGKSATGNRVVYQGGPMALMHGREGTITGRDRKGWTLVDFGGYGILKCDGLFLKQVSK